nr:pentatricopeptide repeat-containing protein [Tanacetum cinerariifolium]
MLIAKVNDNIWALFICIFGLDINGGLKLIESDADVHALYDLAEKHVKLRSPPLQSRPFRNDMKGKVLFTDMYYAEDEGFEMTPPLSDDEVGMEDLLLNVFDLENDIVNDAAKILDGMSASKNDARKYVEYTKSLTDGMDDGSNEGMNEGGNDGMNGTMNEGMNEGMNQGMNEGMDASNNDLDEQVVSRGNDISIRENDGHNVVLTDSESDSSDHAYQDSKSDSDQLEKSFDYLSDGENELIELRKRMRQSKVNGIEFPDAVHFDEVPRDKGKSAQGQYTTVDVDMFGEIDDTCVGLTLLIREREKYMKALLRKLKGNGMGITDPFAIIEGSKEKYPIYDDLTHWKLKKQSLARSSHRLTNLRNV